MAATSVIGLHARVTAEASQFVNELNRADNAQRRTMSSMKESVGKSLKYIEKQFSITKLTKGMIHGFGLATGAKLIDGAIETVSEHMGAAKEHAKEMSEWISKMREDLRDLADKRYTAFMSGVAPEDKARIALPRAEQRTKEIQRQLDEAKKEFDAASIDMSNASMGMTGKVIRVFNPISSRMEDAVSGSVAEAGSNAQERQSKAGEQIQKLQDDLTKALKDEKNIRKEITDIQKKEEDNERKITDECEKALEKQNERDLKFGKDYLRGVQRAADVRVDDMTKRGLGSGARYDLVQKSTNDILNKISDQIKEFARKNLSTPQPEYTD